MLNENVICSDPESKLMSFCVKTICTVGCHGGNNNYWGEGVMKYSSGDVYCCYNVTWNIFCTNHSACGCNTCGDGIETLICCVCICPGDSGKKLILCGALYGISVCGVMLAYLRVPCSANNLPICVHIHHIQSSIHLGNVMLYDLILDIGNIYLLHGT